MRSDPSTAVGDSDEREPIGPIVTKRHPAAAALLVAATAVLGVSVSGIALVGTGTVAAHGSAEFDTGLSKVNENGTAVIVVESNSIDAFEVTVGDEDEVGYEFRATVTPAADGVTSLVFDHSEAGGDGKTVTAQGDGAIKIDYETSLDDTVAPGDYDVGLFVGGGEPTDVSTLVVEDGDDDDTGSDGDATDGSGADEGSVEPATVTEADVEDADLVVEPAETEVRVPVELDDGEEVTLRIRSIGDASPAFLMTEEATVEDGSASAAFDLSRATHGDRATLTVRGNEALDEPVDREVLVVDEEVGVEESDGVLNVETPGFGIVAGGLAVLIAALAVRQRE
ncbi:BGTF surface domain-containing protein [Halorubrum lipolyticum]|uniref:Uncharacterized protein n=1 Tax=Halorubrum lipolyticum DSM 21995 TaxID=1227482 RepID=M0NV68_9EURY|nr:BGTF surface domain-containing protein [Halorubrum lipolyticum]EMA61144.1 hypothetical protein C469_07732 [Halorubrum lipolyticum DSM 21995]